MDQIKSEFGNICQGCLSQDRKILPLGEYSDILNTIIMKKDSTYCVYETDDIKMCFECRAMLKRIKQFQEQVALAQETLELMYYGDVETDPQTLSRLKIFKPVEIDQQYEYIPIDDIKEEPCSETTDSLIIKLEKLSDLEIQRHSSNNEQHSLSLSPTFDDDNIDNHSNEDFYEPNEEKKTTVKIKKKSPKYEARSAVTIKTDVDIENFKKYFTKEFLEEHEYQALYDNGQMCSKTNVKKASCKECSEKFVTKEELSRHVTINHIKTDGKLKCLVCLKILPNFEELKTHVRMVHSIYYRCNLCNTYFNYYNPRKLHLITYHSKLYVCKECGIQLSSVKTYYWHRREYHRRFICDYCNKIVTTKNAIITHIQRKHSPNVCNLCNISFKHYRTYIGHMNAQHRTIKEKELAYCVECDIQFSNELKFKYHLTYSVKHRAKPKTPVSIPCPECGKTYVKRSYMINHYRQTHNRENSKYYCQICDKYYINGYSLRNHHKYVHLKVPKERNQMCDICGRGFSSKKILTNHRRTHTGERPFKCEYCSATFAQRTAMVTHQKKHAKT